MALLTYCPVCDKETLHSLTFGCCECRDKREKQSEQIKENERLKELNNRKTFSLEERLEILEKQLMILEDKIYNQYNRNALLG